MLAGLILILGALIITADTPDGPPVPVHLQAALIENGTVCRFEVTGPPGAGAVLLASPHGGGSAPSTDRRLVVQLWHPFHNFLRRGTLPADGRLTWRMKLPTDPEKLPDTYYLQVVAMDPDPPFRTLGVSRAYRYRRGPPSVLEIVEPARSWWWLLFFLPLMGGALAPIVRRRPAILLVVPAAAIGCLVLAPGPIAGPARDAIRVRGRTHLALDEHLSPSIHRLVRELKTHVPTGAAVLLPGTLSIRLESPGYLAYLLYPRPLVLREEGVRRALVRGRAVYMPGPEPDAPLEGFTTKEVPGFAVPEFRLWRVDPPVGRRP